MEIEKRMEGETFWNDQEEANALIRELKEKRVTVEPIRELEKLMDDAETMAELAEEDGGTEAAAEAEALVRDLRERFTKLDFQLMFDGEYDPNNCFFSIQAGAGGVESCDWTSMLLRMYLRWMERSRYEAEVISILPEEEAGIKSVMLLVKGRWAYGYLKSERGVHRLVRISPFDAQNRRHTSFAAVDVFPEIEAEADVEIDPQDLKVDTYRAAGAGGQHVNKTDSAVRITHLPTGIVVQCQNERSQHQNRATARHMLLAKLYQREQAQRDAELAKMYGEKGEIAFGYQIRSYVLYPYQLVRDERTGLKLANAAAVLDGAIQPFIDAYLRQRLKKKQL